MNTTSRTDTERRKAEERAHASLDAVEWTDDRFTVRMTASAVVSELKALARDLDLELAKTSDGVWWTLYLPSNPDAPVTSLVLDRERGQFRVEHHASPIPDFEGELLAEPVQAVCAYSALHASQGVPATAMLDCGVVGVVPACERCERFYNGR